MRVVYINADCGIPVFGNKGGAVHIREMAHAMISIGCDVKILSARLGEGADRDLNRIVEHVAVEKNANPGADPSSRSAKESSYIQTADAIKSRIVELHKNWPIDLIYERYSLWSSASVSAAKEIGVPVVLEVNAPLVVEQKEHRHLCLTDDAVRIEREAFSQADAVVAVSDNVAKYVSKIAGESCSVEVLGNGVDTKRFNTNVEDCRDDLGFSHDDFVVGFTGSLKNWHGVDTLLKAFAHLRRVEPGARLLVVGDGPKKGWIEGYSEGAGISESVHMAGWVDHSKLPRLVASMDVATAPYPHSENSYFSPLKLFEYFAMGRPIIASDIGQTGSLIVHGKNGLLVPPGDQKALADSFRLLKHDRQLSRVLAANAAKEGLKHSWENNAKAVVRLSKQFRRAA